MAKFTDAEGRDWIIRLNTSNIEKIREVLDIDLVDFSGESFNRLCDDMVLLSRAVWLLCESAQVYKPMPYKPTSLQPHKPTSSRPKQPPLPGSPAEPQA